jgi:F-type H+-transporting ATPase subunit b
MEIVENIALISLNETLIVQLISFLIFLYLINRIMIRPLQQTMGKRQEYISTTESQIHQSAEKLEDLNRQLKKNKRMAIAEANDRREELKNEGSLEAEALLEESRTQMHQIRQKNQEILGRELDEVRKYIDSEAEKLAETIMETILDRGVSRG